MKYKHLFFDLDHTLWDFETNAKYVLLQLFNEKQLTEKGITDFEKFYDRYSFHNHHLWDRYSKGFIQQEELKWKRIWRAMLDFKIADEALAKEMSNKFLERLPLQKAVFPYTFEILTYLKEKGYQLHLITNGFEKVQKGKIQNSQLAAYFQTMTCSEEAMSLKPNKEIFAYALKKAKAQKEASIMIGDNLEADIKGAIDFGMDCIFANHTQQVVESKATYTITHLKELTHIL